MVKLLAMTLLPVVERELRVAARQRKTYLTRLATAGAFLAVLSWMLWITRARNWFNSRDAFEAMAWLAFLSCLLAGVLRTADSLSQEKRDDTLGLLFLTDLKGYDIVLGKLISTSLDTILGLLGILPVLAIPILLGGVSLAQFGCVSLSLVNAMFFSLAVGLFVSALGRDSRRTALLAGLILALFSFVLTGVAETLRYYYKLPEYAVVVRLFSLFDAHELAMDPALWTRRTPFWQPLLTTHLVGQGFLILACLILPRAWREKPSKASRDFLLKRWRRQWQQWNLGQTTAGGAVRTRALELNPFFWLMSRERVSSVGVLLFLLVNVSVGFWVFWYYVAPANRGRFGGFEAFLVGWVFLTAGTHALLLIKIAIVASHRLAEDRVSGALELILSTPLSVGRILRGHWLGLLRQTSGLILAAVVIYLILLWAVLTMIGLEDKPSASLWELVRALWRVFRNQSTELDSQIPFIFLVPLAAFVLGVAHWITLGWVGAWIGLRVKRARNAPWIVLPLVLVPPWLFFLVAVEWLDAVDDLWGTRVMLYFGLALALGLNLMSDLILSLWASRRLRQEFRLVATQRFQREKIGWPWFVRKRFLFRLATAGAVLTALTLSFYRLERWRGERAWQRVLRDAKQRGESLNFESILAPPVPMEQNFFAAPVFGGWPDYLANPQAYGGREPPQVQKLRSVTLSGQPGRYLGPPNGLNLGNWQTRQARVDFAPWQKFYRGQKDFPKTDQPQDPARDVLLALSRFDGELDELRTASHRPLAEVDHRHQGRALHIDLLWQLSQVLRLRATALLAVGRTEDALQDVRLILYLANALQRDPTLHALNWRGTIAMQAIQPIWEGLTDRCWSEDELITLQHMLCEMDLLAGYPRAVRAETLLQIQQWDAFLPGEPDERMFHTGHRHEVWLFMTKIYPSGWIHQNKAKLYRQMQDTLLPFVDSEPRLIADAGQISDRTTMPSGPVMSRNRGGFNARHFIESLARSQTSMDLALVACALERVRIRTGTYPDHLQGLGRSDLISMPMDLFTGEPFQYRRDDDGRFILYSIGWNCRDDGAKGRSAADWVWMYPAD